MLDASVYKCNVGSGTSGNAEWVEYLTSDRYPDQVRKEREDSMKVILAMAIENWDAAGI